MLNLSRTLEDALEEIGEPLDGLQWEVDEDAVEKVSKWEYAQVKGRIDESIEDGPWGTPMIEGTHKDAPELRRLAKEAKYTILPLILFCHKKSTGRPTTLTDLFKEVFRNAVIHGIQSSTANGTILITSILGTRGIIIRVFQTMEGIPQRRIDEMVENQNTPDKLIYKQDTGKKYGLDSLILTRGMGSREMVRIEDVEISFERAEGDFSVLMYMKWKKEITPSMWQEDNF